MVVLLREFLNNELNRQHLHLKRNHCSQRFMKTTVSTVDCFISFILFRRLLFSPVGTKQGHKATEQKH